MARATNHCHPFPLPSRSALSSPSLPRLVPIIWRLKSYSCYVSSRSCRWIDVPSDFSPEAAPYVTCFLCKGVFCGEMKESFLQCKFLGVAVALSVTVYM